MKKILAMAAVAALAAGASVYAANPFSDVDQSDWRTRPFPISPIAAW